MGRAGRLARGGSFAMRARALRTVRPPKRRVMGVVWTYQTIRVIAGDVVWFVAQGRAVSKGSVSARQVKCVVVGHVWKWRQIR